MHVIRKTDTHHPWEDLMYTSEAGSALLYSDCTSESSGLVGCLMLNWVRVSLMTNLGLLKWRRKAIIKTRQKSIHLSLNWQCHLSLSWTRKETNMLEACLLVLLCWQMGRQVPVVWSGWTYLTGKQMDLGERAKWEVEWVYVFARRIKTSAY